MEWQIKFISPFQARFPETHHGFRIQFNVPRGIPVRAMADGIILRASWDDPKDPTLGLGLRIRQLVSLIGFDSWTLVYGQLGSLKTSIGSKVKQGQTIALTGDKPVVVYLLDRQKEHRNIPFESD